MTHEDQIRQALTADVEMRASVTNSHEQWVGALLDALRPLCEAWDAERKALQAYKDRLLDALVVNWAYQKAHDTDARLAVVDLIKTEISMALDQAISKDAHDLVAPLQAKIEALEAKLRGAEARLTIYEPQQCRRGQAHGYGRNRDTDPWRCVTCGALPPGDPFAAVAATVLKQP